ncbi:MAG: DHH family phosphoesterase [Haloferacaceae archaeon]
MLRRLVLGCGGLGRDIVRTAAGWPGEISVVDPDESRVESLRDANVSAVADDPTDPGTYPDAVDVVLVGGADARTNLAAARAARERFPDALVVAYAGDVLAEGGRDPEVQETVASLAELADEVIDPRSALVEQATQLTTGETAARTYRLLKILRAVDPPLAVVAHDNPDPDAIASAVGLCRIAATVDVEAVPCYFGEISHQENRALVNLLDLDLRQLDSPEELEEFGGVALVDHSRPGVNDQLPEDTHVDVVIDHHPPRGPVEAGYVDLRSEAGATSTLVTEHFERLGLTPSETTATALLYGIRVDTREFTREVSESDFEAAATLIPNANVSVLEQVESPNVSAEVLDVIARAITDRTVRGSALTTCVGRITDRDALAQAAERLLDMEGVRTTLVYGFMEGTVYVSGRARASSLDLGETLRDAFDQIGSAGGHADMAGAQIPLGILGDVEDTESDSLTRIVREVVDDRFFESLEGAPTAPTAGAELTYEYPDGEPGPGPVRATIQGADAAAPDAASPAGEPAPAVGSDGAPDDEEGSSADDGEEASAADEEASAADDE